MLDVSCFLAGIVHIFGAAALVLLWHKKTGARFYPALIAFGVCLPAFIIGNAVRSGLSRENFITFYLMQGLLFGIMEEGVKYLALRFLLSAYDSRKDAVTYGIGHSAYEEAAAGITCIGLIGTGNAAPEIFWIAIISVAESALFSAANTVLIFYGLRTDKTKIMLPAAILCHAAANASQGIFIEDAARVFKILLLAGMCWAAYRCWREMDYER